MKIILLLPCFFLFLSTNGDQILILHPMHSPSHVMALRQLAKSLIGRGHQVTEVRPHDWSLPQVKLDNFTEHFVELDNREGKIPMMSHEFPAQFEMPMSVMWQNGLSFTALPLEGFSAVSAYCSAMLSDKKLLKSLETQKFSVAIVDLVYNECGLAIAHHLGIPAIGYWAFSLASGEAMYTTAFNPPSSTPLLLSHLSDKMTFLERLKNHVLMVLGVLVMEVTFAITNFQIQTHLSGVPYPRKLLAELSGMLINSHPSVDYPRQLPPSFIDIGGFQVPQSFDRPLPQNILNFLNQNKSESQGVVVFSLGLTFHSDYVPVESIRSYLEVFQKFPSYKFLMVLKGELDPSVTVASNVLVVPFIPQAQILSLPSTKLFITHCGMHGIFESLTYGVPMVGIPVFFDQEDGLTRLKEKGLAVGLTKHSTREEIYTAIQTVLSDRRYKERAVEHSRYLRNGQDDRTSKAVWLVEHVMETKGAEYLKMASRNLSIFTYLGIDVLLVFIGLLSLIWKCFLMLILKIQSIKSKKKIE